MYSNFEPKLLIKTCFIKQAFENVYFHLFINLILLLIIKEFKI